VPIAQKVFVVGLTPRGGAHVIYCGEDRTRAAEAFDRAGIHFDEVALFDNASPTRLRCPLAEADAKALAARARAQAERENRRARAVRFSQEMAQRRARSRERKLASLKPAGKDVTPNLDASSELTTPSPTGGAELAPEETQ